MLILAIVLFSAFALCGLSYFSYDTGRKHAMRDATPGDIREAWQKKVAKRSARKMVSAIAEVLGKKDNPPKGLQEAITQLILDEMR